jgi:hypothetical protein
LSSALRLFYIFLMMTLEEFAGAIR